MDKSYKPGTGGLRYEQGGITFLMLSRMGGDRGRCCTVIVGNHEHRTHQFCNNSQM